MIVEPYVVVSGTVMLPARCIHVLGEAVNLESRYESGPGYVFSIHKDQKLTLTMLPVPMVAAMLAEEKLS